MNRYLLTDKQWELIEPLLPGKKEDPGRTGANNRLALEGILWVMRTGSPWRDLPERFGKWITVYQRFRRWEKSGFFGKIFQSVGDSYDFSKVMIDGTFVKCHQHAAGAPKVGAHQTNRPYDKRLAGAAVGAQLRS